jgi:hypothetical protein
MYFAFNFTAQHIGIFLEFIISFPSDLHFCYFIPEDTYSFNAHKKQFDIWFMYGTKLNMPFATCLICHAK